MADKNPTVYSQRAFDFVRGPADVVKVPAGPSALLTADELKHWYVRLHVSDKPIAGMNVMPTNDDYSKLQASFDAMQSERDQLASQQKGMAEELEALRTAVGQSASEREKQLEMSLRTLKTENDSMRAELAKAKAAATPQK